MTAVDARPDAPAATAWAGGPTGDRSWVRCAGCAALLYRRRLERSLQVCPDCGHHHRLSASARVDQLVDPGTFAPVAVAAGTDDPLAFTDSLPYRERLAAARRSSGREDGTLVGTAEVEGRRLVLLVMDFGFLGGSMGPATGEAVATAAEVAVDHRLPLVLVTASGGARMQEGVLSLLQMARTAQAVALVREAGLLSTCVLTDPTFGGVTASFASLGDVLVAESGSLVGFAGPRVIRQTVGEQLPPRFQSAESLLAHGLVDRVVAREELRPLLGRLLRLAAAPAASPPTGAAAVEAVRAARDPEDRGDRDAWDVVQGARHPGRPTTLDHCAGLDDFVELHGDRAGTDDPAVVGGLGRLRGRTVVVVGHQKGHDTRELVARRFGMPQPEGYRKALRLVELAERLGAPLVTLVDTPGAYPGVDAEEHGQSAAIAEVIARCTRLRVPVVSVVTGEGGSGGALALATADRLLVGEGAFFSVISPEGCAAILWRTAAAAPEAARALRLTAGDLLELGVADGVVPEPAGGAQADPAAASAAVLAAVDAALEEVADLAPADLLAQRHRRLRGAGGRGGSRVAAGAGAGRATGVRAS